LAKLDGPTTTLWGLFRLDTMSKRTLPRGATSGALYVLAVAAGVLLSKPLAIALAIVATCVLALVIAGTQIVQRRFPDLGRLPLVDDHRFHERLREPPAPAVGSSPPGTGWVDPDELGNYLARINRTMEEHGFGRNPKLPAEPAAVGQLTPDTRAVEIITPERIERNLDSHVKVATDQLIGDAVVDADFVEQWATTTGLTIRAHCGGMAWEGRFLAAGRGKTPREEVEAKIAFIDDNLLPKVRAGYWGTRDDGATREAAASKLDELAEEGILIRDREIPPGTSWGTALQRCTAVTQHWQLKSDAEVRRSATDYLGLWHESPEYPMLLYFSTPDDARKFIDSCVGQLRHIASELRKRRALEITRP
jgi:hypothetical protein